MLTLGHIILKHLAAIMPVKIFLEYMSLSVSQYFTFFSFLVSSTFSVVFSQNESSFSVWCLTLFFLCCFIKGKWCTYNNSRTNQGIKITVKFLYILFVPLEFYLNLCERLVDVQRLGLIIVVNFLLNLSGGTFTDNWFLFPVSPNAGLWWFGCLFFKWKLFQQQSI